MRSQAARQLSRHNTLQAKLAAAEVLEAQLNAQLAHVQQLCAASEGERTDLTAAAATCTSNKRAEPA